MRRERRVDLPTEGKPMKPLERGGEGGQLSLDRARPGEGNSHTGNTSTGDIETNYLPISILRIPARDVDN